MPSEKTTTKQDVRWGVLSTAKIAVKNCRAIQAAEGCVLTAVASRSLRKAEAWSLQFGTVRAYGSYQELLDDPEIDAVYIPLPTGIRKEWICRAAASGKHVLSEKPVGVNLSSVQKIVEACRTAGVLFMDGVMFMHHRRLSALRPQLPLLGPLSHLTSVFTFNIGESAPGGDIRLDPVTEPLGCLGDLGWYNIRFYLWAMGWVLPEEVTATTLSSTADGVPTAMSARLLFRAPPREEQQGDGHRSSSYGGDQVVVAEFHCGFGSCRRQWVEVAGAYGSLSLNDFVIASSDTEPSLFTVRCGMRETPQGLMEDRLEGSVGGCCQQQQMFSTFADLVLSQRSPAACSSQQQQQQRGDWVEEGTAAFWPHVTCLTQSVLDACIHSAALGGQPVAPKHPSMSAAPPPIDAAGTGMAAAAVPLADESKQGEPVLAVPASIDVAAAGAVSVGVTQWSLQSGTCQVLGPDALFAAAKLGFDCIHIESGAGRWQGFPDATSDPHVVAAYHRASTLSGVSIAAVSCNVVIEGSDNAVTASQGWFPDCRGVSVLAPPGSEEHALLMQYITQSIRVAAALGAPLFCLPSFFASRCRTDADIAATAAVLAAACEFAREHAPSVVVTTENTLGVEGNQQLLKAAAQPDLKLFLDCQNMDLFAPDSAPTLATALGPHLSGPWHAKDGNKRYGGPQKELLPFASFGNAPLGLGEAPMAETLAIMAQRPSSGDTPVVISENAYCVDTTAGRDIAARDIRFLRNGYIQVSSAGN